MRYLGIDHGKQHIGLAFGDDESYLALPSGSMVCDTYCFERLSQMVQKEDIQVIVVGNPLNMSGNETAQTKVVHAFVETLQKRVAIPIVLEDERLSSKLASTLRKDLGKIAFDEHAVAAASILQTYLERKGNDL